MILYAQTVLHLACLLDSNDLQLELIVKMQVIGRLSDKLLGDAELENAIAVANAEHLGLQTQFHLVGQQAGSMFLRDENLLNVERLQDIPMQIVVRTGIDMLDAQLLQQRYHTNGSAQIAPYGHDDNVDPL